MKTKTFSHNEIEKCKISKKDINTEEERYSIILDCDKENIYSIGFYKTELLKDLIKEKGKEVVKTLLGRQKDVMNNILNSDYLKKFAASLAGNGEEVFEIGI